MTNNNARYDKLLSYVNETIIQEIKNIKEKFCIHKSFILKT